MPGCKGFTLIEVIVALAILATTLFGGWFLLKTTITNTQAIQDKTLAHWVAMNALANTELESPKADEQQQEDQLVTMLGVEFLLSVNYSDERLDNTGDIEKALSTLKIRVTKNANPNHILEDIVIRRERVL